MELTNSFEVLLRAFSPVFTDPSFQTFRLLMTGWILSFRHRYVTDLIVSSDSVGNGHFSDYHRFFSHAVWNIDQLWRLLAMLIVDRLIGKDATIVLAGDDTLCRKRGLGIFGTGMHHDPLSSSKSTKICHWGSQVRAASRQAKQAAKAKVKAAANAKANHRNDGKAPRKPKFVVDHV